MAPSTLALLTDLYQLTMAYGYWKQQNADRRAVFHLFFRNAPFGGGYALAAGLGPVLEYVQNFRFDQEDCDYLAELPGNDGKPLFEPAFLQYLSELRLQVDIDAMLEGTVAFPHEPLLRVQGRIIECQILETALLNIINFQTLIATKASRVVHAAQGDQVLEFGLRRAQGVDGALAASRASYIGGCHATSNVLAGKMFGIPVRGTHAHSWVMSFDSELEAFAAYADAMPNNCVFLVDTYDTLDGVRNAIRIGQKLRESGHRMVGIRLDSGDLAQLSIEARKLLDEAGFEDAAIVASNDLDEKLIESLKHQGSKITVWGVGTKLITAFDQPALGGVYKLGAVQDASGSWLPKIKLSEQLIKTSTPGILQVRRYRNRGLMVADRIWNELDGIDGNGRMVDPFDPTHRFQPPAQSHEDLLVPVVRQGQSIGPQVSLSESRDRAIEQMRALPPQVRRFDNPHRYLVGLDERLYELKSRLMISARDQEMRTNLP